MTMAIKKVPKTAFLVHVLFGAVFKALEHGLAMLSKRLLPIRGTLQDPRSTAKALRGAVDLICGHSGVLNSSNFQLSEGTGGPMRRCFRTRGAGKLKCMPVPCQNIRLQVLGGRYPQVGKHGRFGPFSALRQIELGTPKHMHSCLPVGQGP